MSYDALRSTEIYLRNLIEDREVGHIQTQKIISTFYLKGENVDLTIWSLSLIDTLFQNYPDNSNIPNRMIVYKELCAAIINSLLPAIIGLINSSDILVSYKASTTIKTVCLTYESIDSEMLNTNSIYSYLLSQLSSSQAETTSFNLIINLFNICNSMLKLSSKVMKGNEDVDLNATTESLKITIYFNNNLDQILQCLEARRNTLEFILLLAYIAKVVKMCGYIQTKGDMFGIYQPLTQFRETITNNLVKIIEIISKIGYTSEIKLKILQLLLYHSPFLTKNDQLCCDLYRFINGITLSDSDSHLIQQKYILTLTSIIEASMSIDSSHRNILKTTILENCANMISGLEDKDILFHLFNIFESQDDSLILLILKLQSIYSVLSKDFSNELIYKQYCNNDKHYELVKFYLENLNPTLVFLKLFESVCFDHSVLLDFLVSGETEFLQYFLNFLNISIETWPLQYNTLTKPPHFSINYAQTILNDFIRFRLGLERMVEKKLFPYNAKPLINKMIKLENLFEVQTLDI